jgi:hypothetical protein
VTSLPVPVPRISDPHEDIPTSDLLIRIIERCADDEISVGELIDGLGERAFGIILLILTLPAAVPGPPGIPSAFAVPILLVAAQLFLERRRLWFPGFIRRRRVSRQLLLAIFRRVQPMLRRLEDVCRPRLLPLTGPKGERWVGAFIFLCGLVLLNPIPIPFSHIPLAVAMVILSLGYVERDGYILIAGGIGALFGIAFNVSLMGGILVIGKKLLGLFRP